MVNEVALVLLFGLFGWKVAVLYLATGLVVALVADWTLGRLHLERHLESWVLEAARGASVDVLQERLPFAERTPALVIDGGVKSTGKVLPPEDILALLRTGSAA